MYEEEKKAFAGKLFFPGDPELKALKLKAHNLSQDFNRLHEDETEQRNAILKELIGEMGERVFIQGPITFHYGCHTSIGSGTYINFNVTIQDDAPVRIGKDCNLGPGATIVTPVHPMLPGERRYILDKDGVPRHMCYAKPVVIGNDCWFGANVTVLPGVTIGDNVVIGAGSVVSRDIPSNTFAAGVPCRVIRPITEKDSMKYKPEILGENRVIEEE